MLELAERHDECKAIPYRVLQAEVYVPSDEIGYCRKFGHGGLPRSSPSMCYSSVEKGLHYYPTAIPLS